MLNFNSKFRKYIYFRKLKKKTLFSSKQLKSQEMRKLKKKFGVSKIYIISELEKTIFCLLISLLSNKLNLNWFGKLKVE